VLPLLKEAEELTAIFISSRKTTRQKKSSIENFQLKGLYIEKDRTVRRTHFIYPY
jgi:hypothetical protein